METACSTRACSVHMSYSLGTIRWCYRSQTAFVLFSTQHATHVGMERLTQDDFRELHSPQLQALGFPETLIAELYSKLSSRSHKGPDDDLNRHFDVSTGTRSSNEPIHAIPGSTGWLLRSNVRMLPGSRVFIVPHAWESDGGRHGRQDLMKDPQLLVRVERLLSIQGSEQTQILDFEKVDDELLELVCSQSEKPRSIARKALQDSRYDVIAALVAAETLSKADCQPRDEASRPTITFEEFKTGLTSMAGGVTSIPDGDARYLYEDYLQKKASGPVEDDNGWIHCGLYSWTDAEEEDTVVVTIPLSAGTSKRDITSRLRVHHWKLEVCERTGGRRTIFDRDFSAPVVPDESFWTLEGNVMNITIQKARPGDKWSTLLRDEVQLAQSEVEKLERFSRQRLRVRVQRVMERMWSVSQTYQAVTPEGRQKPVWYLMDRHGLALAHSDKPNFVCKPFANAVTGKVMSLLWPAQEVREGEVCTRDFVPLLHAGESPWQREARKNAILNIDSLSMSENSYQSKAPPVPTGNALPPHPLKDFQIPDSKKPLKVFLSENNSNTRDWKASTTEGYLLVGSAEDADIVLGDVLSVLSGSDSTSEYLLARLSGDKCLVTKSGLCHLTRGKGGGCFAQGVDLTQEAARLLCQGQEGGLVKTWRVVLPEKRGVSVQPRVTRNTVETVRCLENGPCVASQFCILTVLHENRRCCLQYPVVVRPPNVYLHSTSPRVRLAEKQSKEGFDPWDTDALLTSSDLTAQWEDFLRQITTGYKASWTRVQEKVNSAIRELFQLALPLCAAKGTAVYTVDVLLKHPSLSPVVIGVDCLPSFSSAHVARQCLDLLVGRRDCGEEFVQLLPV